MRLSRITVLAVALLGVLYLAGGEAPALHLVADAGGDDP